MDRLVIRTSKNRQDDLSHPHVPKAGFLRTLLIIVDTFYMLVMSMIYIKKIKIKLFEMHRLYKEFYFQQLGRDEYNSLFAQTIAHQSFRRYFLNRLA